MRAPDPACGNAMKRSRRQLWRFACAVLGGQRMCAASLVDGSYAFAWPLVASLAPWLTLCCGMAQGWFHFVGAATFTMSLAVLVFVLSIGELGAVFGLFFCVGYALADLANKSLMFSRDAISHAIGPLILGALAQYVHLFSIAVVVPLTASQVTIYLHRTRQRSDQSGIITAMFIHAIACALLVLAWTLASPVFVFASYRLSGAVVPADALKTLVGRGMIVLTGAALAVGLLRVVLEAWARKKPSYRGSLDGLLLEIRRARSKALKLPKWISPAVLSAVAVAGLQPLCFSGWQTTGLAAGLFLIGYSRRLGQPYFAPLDRSLTRLPTLIRFSLAVFLSFVVVAIGSGETRNHVWPRLPLTPTLIAIMVAALSTSVITLSRQRTASSVGTLAADQA